MEDKKQNVQTSRSCDTVTSKDNTPRGNVTPNDRFETRLTGDSIYVTAYVNYFF